MCALRLTPTKLYFILTDNAAVGGVSIWCELTQVRLKNVLHCLIVLKTTVLVGPCTICPDHVSKMIMSN